MSLEVLQDGVEDFLGAELPGLGNELLETVISEIVSARVFSFDDPIGVEDKDVAGLEGEFLGFKLGGKERYMRRGNWRFKKK